VKRFAPGRRWFVLASVLLLMAVLWWDTRGVGELPAAGPEFAAAPVPSIGIPSAGPLIHTEPAAAAIPARQGEKRLPEVDEIEVCGGAWVRVQADGVLDQADLDRATRLPQARARIVAALRAGASDLSQVAALWLTMMSAGADGDRALDALVRRAVSSSDPKAYALAFNSCGGDRRSTGACPMLSAAQWARLDPGNLSPWLAMLADAKARKDRAAEDEALHRMATARRSELGTFSLPDLVVNAASDDDAAVLAAWAMADEMIGAASAWGMPGYQHLTDACKGVALRDANRRQTCAAIAEVLSEHADTVLERRFGTLIGAHAGWPAERVDRVRGEHAAYEAFLSAAAPFADGQRGLSCSRLRRDLDHLRRLARLGETGVLREWVAQSGKSPDDFVRAERAQEKQALEDARAQAASAASAPRP
jgi:hypothetical protein